MPFSHRLTVLVDNTAQAPNLIAEHGLSLHLDLATTEQWLWDTGQTGETLLANAAELGCKLGASTGVALSHGHYDHTGGLRALLEKTDFTGPILGHPLLDQERFVLQQDKLVRSIGLPAGTSLPRFSPVEHTALLASGLTFVSTIERAPERFSATAHFFLDREGEYPDPVQDDACLVLDTADGPVVILGCCHSGLANTLNALRERLGHSTITGVMGGMHLNGAPTWALEESLQSLEEFEIQWIAPGHCTGRRATTELARRFSGRVLPFGVGTVFEFPALT
ncbi:MAG: MBL fold metallo-hydrolase [Desulfohalobium sp.]